MKSYKTINRSAQASIDIDKSNFIGIAAPLITEDDVETVMMEVKAQYPNATHYVYGYTVGRKQKIMRFRDDGEPSGTAGLPILEIIKHKELEDILIIVVRYFGGIKLGTGGLKRAYSKAALEVLDQAGIITLSLCSLIVIRCPYTFWGKVQYEFEERKVLVEKLDYREEVEITVAVPYDETQEFEEWLNGITSSQINLDVSEQVYCQLPKD